MIVFVAAQQHQIVAQAVDNTVDGLLINRLLHELGFLSGLGLFSGHGLLRVLLGFRVFAAGGQRQQQARSQHEHSDLFHIIHPFLLLQTAFPMASHRSFCRWSSPLPLP